MSSKPSNPKDAIAHTKPPLELIPPAAVYWLAMALRNGALKYGRWNWREAGARSDVYIGAMLRHVFAWASGEDLDPESRLPHLAHVLANAAIVLDADLHDKLIDNRHTVGESAPEAALRAHLAELVGGNHAT